MTFPDCNIKRIGIRDVNVLPYGTYNLPFQIISIKFMKTFEIRTNIESWNASTQLTCRLQSSHFSFSFFFFFLSEKNHTQNENVRTPITLSIKQAFITAYNTLLPSPPDSHSHAPPHEWRTEDATNPIKAVRISCLHSTL